MLPFEIVNAMLTDSTLVYIINEIHYLKHHRHDGLSGSINSHHKIIG